RLSATRASGSDPGRCCHEGRDQHGRKDRKHSHYHGTSVADPGGNRRREKLGVSHAIEPGSNECHTDLRAAAVIEARFMTARSSLVQEKTRGHRPRLQPYGIISLVRSTDFSSPSMSVGAMLLSWQMYSKSSSPGVFRRLN